MHTAPLSLKQPTGARIRIGLVLKVSGKPLRPRDLARGRPFGTMARNRAAFPNILWQSLDPLLFSRPVLYPCIGPAINGTSLEAENSCLSARLLYANVNEGFI